MSCMKQQAAFYPPPPPLCLDIKIIERFVKPTRSNTNEVTRAKIKNKQRDLASRLRPTSNGKRQAAACRKSKKMILF